MSSSEKVSPWLLLGALGTVYGDIGTSPLYAFKEALHVAGGATPQSVLGILSLIFWSLLLVVSLKYVALVLRADNAGEGGILAMLALLQRVGGNLPSWIGRVVMLGAFGAALFYCDALITPAISVLSAVEGLELLSPVFKGSAVPVTLVILVVLFAIQRFGTERIGRSFGYVMVVWFAVIAALGVVAIAKSPSVLMAVNPVFGVQLMAAHPGLSLVILAGVFLVVTGGEALYADMGHFGKGPVRAAWFGLVWPSLLLNYFGQGALVLLHPDLASEAFFALAPAEWLPALVVLATAATIIASQATISGAFSVTRQAVQLDLLPRVRILQTSETAHGQIYVPAANLFMFVCVCLFVVGFRSSTALSSAYGTSVVGTMLITTLLGAAIARHVWRWSTVRVAGIFGSLVLVDLLFVIANATKIPQGGWITLFIAILMFIAFLSWRDGRIALRKRLRDLALPLAELPRLLAGAQQVPGTAVFLVSDGDYVPTALLRNLEHNRVFHESIVIVHFLVLREPRVDPLARIRMEDLFVGVTAVTAKYGFMEAPDLSEVLKAARLKGLRTPSGGTSYFVGKHIVRAADAPDWWGWRRRVFGRMQAHSAAAMEYFNMPQQRVVVLGTEVDIS